ncbi:MAG: hypothetical protein U5J98_04205 [Halobacteriales archaeon]|nr:hypothetical protein [Halobacteriales archaeon]
MSEHRIDRPGAAVGRAISEAWRTMVTVYYANSLSWRAFKSGALVFFGFFLWSSANLLLSYQPAWGPLNYVMAYGFLLIPLGPLHHLVVIPVYIKWRRQGRRLSLGHHLHLPNLSLAVFLALVVLLGTFPGAVGAMSFDFDSRLEAGGVDINPDLACTKSTVDEEAVVHCHLTDTQGIDTVVVESAGERLVVDRSPPFDFTVRESQLKEIVGQKQFQVVLLDEEGEELRRYTRTLGMIREG